MQATVVFMATMKYMNHNNKNSLIDYKYKMKLRAQDLNEVVIRQRTLKGNYFSKKLAIPTIEVVKTPSLMKKD